MKSKEKNKRFDENSTIKEILESKRGFEVLIKYNVPCLGCPMASLEISRLKLGEVARVYGLDLKKILKELNSERMKKR